MASDPIRVVLADDHAVVRAGLRRVLGAATDISVVGEASTGSEAIAAVERLSPDVLVTDLSMSGIDGIAVTRELVAQGAATKLLILTMHSEEEYLLPLLEAGASGYLVKSAADRELVAAVRAVAYGDTYVSPAASGVRIQGILRRDPEQLKRKRYEALTAREKDVVRYVAEGYNAPEIGERMVISPKTVDTYKQRIHEKIGISHRADCVQYALKLRILTKK